MSLFDWLRRKREPAPPLVWHVYRDAHDIVAEDGRGGSYRVALSGARGVRIVPLTGGNPHAGVGQGYQVAIQRVDGDAAVGKPMLDWRLARELAHQLCDTADLQLDELTQRMFSQVGQFGSVRPAQAEPVEVERGES
ncbi:MAG TPA: hypothetical protein VGL99_34110 [Chloroflexota bacterium]